ncbi:GntR family transcriptional regulator [Ruminococcus sp. CLA-AA-H200]|uniref:GntR family transcriptional regulator n=1 Tax=Ruminococcus turbiniformis TaxID=2881258 RepID=A0ABS8FVG1_9FIRM|nr:GntR family transcriptional regulator [Ruminococcus turbiniformis]MCC2253609.1 GntR family transcriptional regulator [Ruminococcus turbiniformis]
MYTHRPLQEKAYHHLKKLITECKLEPNVIYSETKMCSELGISRTPFKDALVRLSQDKYIDIIPSKGFCLHQMSYNDVHSTYQVRVAIETFCAINLSGNINNSESQKCIKKMYGILASMKEALKETEDIAVFSEFDFEFHRSLVNSAKNDEFDDLFASYQYRISSLTTKNLIIPGSLSEACNEHEQILKAISTGGNVGQLYGLIETHLEQQRNIVLSYLSSVSSDL